MINLVSLNISNNQILSFDGMHTLLNLEVLIASNNKISSAVQVHKLSSNQKLRELSLQGNPISNKNIMAYRSEVVMVLPHLYILDGSDLTREKQHVPNVSFQSQASTDQQIPSARAAPPSQLSSMDDGLNRQMEEQPMITDAHYRRSLLTQ